MEEFKASLNDQEVGYLIHGQPFSLNFSIQGAAYVLIYYRAPVRGNWWKRFRFSRPNGIFNSITNAYAPDLRFYAFRSFLSLLPKKHTLTLQINFLNVVNRQPDLISPQPPEFPQVAKSLIPEPNISLNEPEHSAPVIHLPKQHIQIDPALTQYP